MIKRTFRKAKDVLNSPMMKRSTTQIFERAVETPTTPEFVLEEPLSEHVFQARDVEGTKYIVKTKTLKRPAVTSLINEMDMLRLLNHPSIPKVVAYFPSGLGGRTSSASLVLEYSFGEDLFSYVTRYEMLPLNLIRTIFYELCKVVEFAHSAGVFHRDLKPENIIYDPVSGKIRVIDWEFAERIGSNHNSSAPCGSIHYVAPEVFTYPSHVGPINDVWSLGVILFVLLSRSVPFDGDTQSDVLAKEEMFAVRYDRKRLPESSKALLRQILVPYTGRISIHDILHDSWMLSTEEERFELVRMD